MSLYQTGPPRLRLTIASFASAPVLAAGFALVKTESLLAITSHRVMDALFVFAQVILPMVAFIALLFLLSSADPSTAVPGALDSTGMLILPP